MPRPKSSRRFASWPCRGALVDVRVPAADVGERDLEPDVRLRSAARSAAAPGRTRLRGYSAPFSGWYSRGSAALSILHRVERFAAGAVQHAVGRGRVLRFERGAARVAPGRRGCRTGRSGSSRAPAPCPAACAAAAASARRRETAWPLRARRACRYRFSQPSACSSRRASPSPCSPARRNATACCRAIRTRGRSRAAARSQSGLSGCEPRVETEEAVEIDAAPSPPSGRAIAMLGRAR